MPVTLPRRLAAILYDLLLLAGVLFAASLPLIALRGGAAITPGDPVYLGYLLLVSYGYFAHGWVHGGQTLGMKSWRVRLVSVTAAPFGYRRALLRFLVALGSWACCGVGFFWSLADPQRRGWHDRASGTALIHEPCRQQLKSG
ncbi:MAG: RDD family protein [Gammaproteobacteria bacterium]|nr:RDD family protein [Gammaproteobacteria bacterium]